MEFLQHHGSLQKDTLPVTRQNPFKTIVCQSGKGLFLQIPGEPAIVGRSIKALVVAIPIQVVTRE
jgi:hypothetical protein